MASSGTIAGGTNNSAISAELRWSTVKDTANNRTTVKAQLVYWRTTAGYTTYGTWKGYIIINGTKFYGSKYVELTTTKTIVLEASIVVPHNADGTKTISLSADGGIEGTSLAYTNLYGKAELDVLLRPAVITSAPNFNDEDNPVINYTNYSGTNVGLLQACISFDGSKDDIAYRDISKTDTSYTFNLTESERRILRAGITDGNSRTVKFYIKTYVNNANHYSSLSKTFTVVNGNPTITPTVEDVDTKTLALTGSKDIIVKYFSDAKYTINAKAIKESILTSQKITCGNKSSTAASGTLTDVESGDFIFNAADSRGNVSTITVKKVIVPYVKLTSNITPKAPTASGNMILTVSGNYYNNTFGAVANSITLYYRYKENDGSFTDWIAATPKLNKNAYSAEITITGLNYQSKYTFQARVIDKLMDVSSSQKSVKTTPVFDWGENDFRFNVPVLFAAGGNLPHKLLWQGKNYMNASQIAYLTEPISEQFSGIVLVFSNYDTSSGTGVANNYDWHCFYIPKRLVELHDGTGHTFNMMSQAFGDIASKYLYIGNTEIRGNDVNTTNGTRNGITYNNAKYVLRYVLGV